MTARLFGRSSLAAVAAWCLAFLIALSSGGPAGSARAQGPDLGTDAQRESGKKLYLKFCSQCHGENGDGEGYATPHLNPKPRNFTTGKYKIRTTPTGALPTQQDLVNIIRRGMPYTSMPAWPSLSDQEVSDLAYFIKSFSPEFAKPDAVPQPVALASAPKVTKESIELGKRLYEETGCVKCHGTFGRGDGPSAPTLKDDWGNPIRPADLSQSWTFRGGSSREDIFRSMSTGLNGTPMPGFSDDALKPEQRWAITDFVDSLSGTGGQPGYSNLLVAKHVQDPIDLAKGAASFASAPAARFPIVGQIMEPGRSFHPPATSVLVQAIYDGQSIAFLVRWHDMTADKTAKNGPSLPVPIEEEDAAPASPPTPLPIRRRRRWRRSRNSPTPSRSRFRRRCRPARGSRISSSATARTRWTSGSSTWPAPRPSSSPAREARTWPRTTRASSRGSRTTTRGNGRSFSSGRFAPRRARRSRPGSSCRSRSRSGTGSRASVATGEASRPGSHSTSSRKWSRHPSARW